MEEKEIIEKLEANEEFQKYLVKICTESIMTHVISMPDMMEMQDVDKRLVINVIINALTTATCNVVLQCAGQESGRLALDEVIKHINIYKRDILANHKKDMVMQ